MNKKQIVPLPHFVGLIMYELIWVSLWIFLGSCMRMLQKREVFYVKLIIETETLQINFWWYVVFCSYKWEENIPCQYNALLGRSCSSALSYLTLTLTILAWSFLTSYISLATVKNFWKWSACWCFLLTIQSNSTKKRERNRFFLCFIASFVQVDL